MSNVYEHLREVRSDASAETERRAGEMNAQLHFARLDDLTANGGLRGFLESFRTRARELGDRVSQDFLVPLSL